MLPDRVSNPGPLTYESGAVLIALRGPAQKSEKGDQHTRCPPPPPPPIIHPHFPSISM